METIAIRILEGNVYYGIYASSTTGQTGCVKQFCSIPKDKAAFPPLVQWDCSACKKQHNFRFNKSMLVNSPKRVKDFVEYCEENHIDMDIDVSF